MVCTSEVAIMHLEHFVDAQLAIGLCQLHSLDPDMFFQTTPFPRRSAVSHLVSIGVDPCQRSTHMLETHL